MKLTLLGDGGFHISLMFCALLVDQSEHRVTELKLWDTDVGRLAVTRSILQTMVQGYPRALGVRMTQNLEEIVAGIDFVLSTIRVGGTESCATEETITHYCRVLGQETTGSGGLDYAPRGIPTAARIAKTITRLAPGVHLIDLINSTGTITEVSPRIPGNRVIGICGSPAGLARRVLDTLEGAGLVAMRTISRVTAGDDRVRLDYVGLNHPGWLQRLLVNNDDVLLLLLGHPDLIEFSEEGRLFDAGQLRQLESVPDEHLHYYYFAHETRRADGTMETIWRVFLAVQQRDLYIRTAAPPGPEAYVLWETTRLRREKAYMTSSRLAAGGVERGVADSTPGGYDRVVLAVMEAIVPDETTDLIINLRNGDRLSELFRDTVIGVPCRIGATKPALLPISSLPEHIVELVQSIKYTEHTTIWATLEDSLDLTIVTSIHHLPVDGVGVARELLGRVRTGSPGLGYLS